MTVLDTFYLAFKNQGLDQSRAEVAQLDKQIAELAAKGKKRSDDESKQLKELRKQRLESTQDLKDQNREVDKLGQSFNGLIENAVGAATAIGTLAGLKSGILDAQKFNRELAIQSKISGQNVTEIKALGAAYESSGGSQQGFLSLLQNWTAIASQAGRPLRNIKELIDFIREDISKIPTLEGKQFRLQTQYGLPLESLAFFEQSHDDYQRAIRDGYDLAAVTKEDADLADNFGAAWSHVAQALESDFTHLGSDIFPGLVTQMNELTLALVHLREQRGGVEAFFSAMGVASLAALTPVGRLVALLLAGANVIGGGVNDIQHPKRGRQSFIGKASDYVAGLFDPDVKNYGTQASPARVPKDALAFWQSQGFTRAQAAGLAANEQAESGGNPGARNGRHYGLYQWDETRRATILANTGIDVANAGIDQQRAAAAWELRSRGDDLRIKSATSAGQSAAIANQYFEVSGENPLKRISIANQIASQQIDSTVGIPNSTTQNIGGGSNLNVKIDDITVKVDSGDPDAIARGIGTALRNEFRNAIWNADDGRTA